MNRITTAIKVFQQMHRLLIFTENPIEHIIKEGTTRIGRGNGNDILLTDDTISGQHAQISSQTGADGQAEITLTDLDSTNGTFVNGKRVKTHILKDNDQFALGTVKCVYLENEL